MTIFDNFLLKIKKPNVIVKDFNETYIKENRKFQGIPTIEITKNNRLFAAWQIGGNMEPHEDNCICLAISDDDGKTWIDPYMIIDNKIKKYRLCNPVLWTDPLNRLWLFYSQTSPGETEKMGVWATVLENPDDEIANFKWSKVKRYTDYIIINKPIVLDNRMWIYNAQDFKNRSITYTYGSSNNGKSFKKIGKAISHNPKCKFSETMLLSLENKLVQYSRLEGGTNKGMEYSESKDDGVTWTDFVSDLEYPFNGPGTRFNITKLKSGNVLFINNNHPKKRTNMTLYLFNKDLTKFDELLIDDREYLSYPDSCQSENGTIYAIYDRDRSNEREIIMAKFTEEDIVNKNKPEIKLISKAI